MKLKWKYLETKIKQSHPVRVRGLKLDLSWIFANR